PSYKVDATYGVDFDGGRGHALLSGEFVGTQGIYDYDPSWNKSGFFKVINPAYKAGAGLPYYLIEPGIGAGEVAPGGLVLNSVTTGGASSNLLRGTYFGVNGAVNQLAFGTTTGQWMIGGDTAVTQSNYEGTSSLAAGETRENLFGRVGYYLTPETEVWAEASVTRYKGRSYYMQPPQVGGITIKADNAFLPQSIRNYMAANNLASINMGSTDEGFPESGSLDGREAQRFSAGADGTLSVLSTDWKWDLTGQIGITDTREQETPVWNTNYLNQAADSVFVTPQNVGTSGLSIGSIACRSTLTAPGNGCVPISRIGVNGGLQDSLMGAGSFQKGLNYVLGTPYRNQRLNEQDYSFNVSGNPIDDWAGPISVAFGGEWRLESINGFVPSTPAGSITDYTNGWLFGNYLVNHGHYSVGEGYVETVVPVMQGMDVNGAFRYAAYSTSGGVNTWKLGSNYAPIDDIKFRVTYSHDIRAPNLNDLFATGTRRTNTVSIYNTSYTFIQNQRGSQLVGTDLKPESANSLGAGVVLTPSFIPGLAASVDYYNITISGAIGTLSAQNVADQCYLENLPSACAFVQGDGGVATAGTLTNPGHVPAVGPNLTYINLAPINYAKQKAEGIDFDITYNVPMDALSGLVGPIPGDLVFNALATNYMRNYLNDGINPPTDSAGANTADTPNWAYRISATYHTDPWTFFIMGRGVSAGVYNNNYITCTSGCPDYTVANPTTNLNSIPGAFYVDTSLTYSFEVGDAGFDVFLAVKNLFDTNPPLVGSGPDANNTPAYPETNRDLYDYLGRVFRMGIRLNM
ncbi:MAG TPA: TonB-dependent receptor, partial [Rhizomicrobium sp.]|nr:TonB-dependent receptor [Rhizomicrobium sp.]